MTIYEQLHRQETEIARLKAQLTQKDVVGQRLLNEFLDLRVELARRSSSPDAKIAELRIKIREKDVKIAGLAAQLIERDVEIAELTRAADTRAASYHSMLRCSSEKDTLIATLNAKVKELDTRLGCSRVAYQRLEETHKKDQEHLNYRLKMSGENSDFLEKRCKELEDAVIINNETFRMAENQIKARDTKILALTGEIQELKYTCKRLRKQAAKSRDNFNVVCAQLKAIRTGPIPFDVIGLRQEVAAKQTEIETLKYAYEGTYTRCVALEKQVKKYRSAACRVKHAVDEGLGYKTDPLESYRDLLCQGE